MARQRAPSGASNASSQDTSAAEQELGTMYDYLAKIILLGPSGCGKSCLLHRFVRNEWRVLSSQTIGVEFSSRIVKVGTGARRKRVKLQLWDTAGQERFRSVTRSYYRGAAGALLIYDITSHPSFAALPTFLADARALASPNLTVVLVGNKADLEKPPAAPSAASSSVNSSFSMAASSSAEVSAHNPWREEVSEGTGPRGRGRGYTWDPYGDDEEEVDEDAPTRAVSQLEANRWASLSGIPVAMETSALNGDNVEEVFQRLARMIVTKIELGEVDPDDPASGIQYGDGGGWVETSRRGGRKEGNAEEGWRRSLREWESVFRRDAARRGGRCC